MKLTISMNATAGKKIGNGLVFTREALEKAVVALNTAERPVQYGYDNPPGNMSTRIGTTVKGSAKLDDQGRVVVEVEFHDVPHAAAIATQLKDGDLKLGGRWLGDSDVHGNVALADGDFLPELVAFSEA